MKIRKIALGTVAGAGLFLAGFTVAQHPAQNVAPNRHPNLAQAQNLIAQAYNKLIAAQQYNEWDMSGHAAKAKEYLDRAGQEIKAAAEASNRH